MSFKFPIPGHHGSFHVPNPSGAIQKVEHAVDGAVQQVKHAGDGAVQQVKHAGDGAVQQVKHAGDGAIQQVEHAGKGALQQVEHAVEGIGGELEHLVVEALLTLGSEATKPTLLLAAELVHLFAEPLADKIKEHPQRAEELNKIPFVVTVSAGVVNMGFYWHQVPDRAQAIGSSLHQYASKGIGTTRSAILRALKDLGPDHVDFDAGGKLSLGIQIGARAGVWAVPTDIFLDLADKLMEKAGVSA